MSAVTVAVLTAIGLILALLTFRRTLGSRAELEMSIGQEILLHYSSTSRLILTADFSFINKGALPGLVIEISARMYDPVKPERLIKSLLWTVFEVSEVTGKDPEDGHTLWWTHSDAPVHTLIVSGRAAGSSGITAKLRLVEEPSLEPYSSEPPQPLKEDVTVTYPVTFRVRAASSSKEFYEYPYQLKIAKEHAQELRKRCTEHPTWRERLILRRRLVTDVEARRADPAGQQFDSTIFRRHF